MYISGKMCLKLSSHWGMGNMMFWFSRKRSERIMDRSIKSLLRGQKVFAVLAVSLMMIGTFFAPIVQAVTQREPQEIEEAVETDEQTYDPASFADVAAADVLVEAEVEQMRSVNEKVFRKVDGSYEVAIYPDAVHYLRDGRYQDIDNTLIEKQESVLNRANAFDIVFPKTLRTDTYIKLKQDDYEVHWKVVNAKASKRELPIADKQTNDKTAMTNLNASIQYKDVLLNTDLEYVLSGSKVKENIYLKRYMEDVSFTFEYQLKGLAIVQMEGNLYFVNESGAPIFSFAGLYMIDSEDNISSGVEVTYQQMNEETYIITVIPDTRWLKTASFPVLIDPTIVNPTVNMSLTDSYIYEGSPMANYALESFMEVGGSKNYEYKGIVKFNLPSVVNNQVITYAHLELKRTDTKQHDYQINIFKNLYNFNINLITWENGSYLYDENDVVDYYHYSVHGQSKVIFDVTETVKQWQAGVARNYGFTLAADDLSGEVKTFYQYDTREVNKPVVRIGYEDPAGIKNYWTYQQQDLGAAGTGFVTDYSGNLSFVRQDYGLDNANLPLNLSFYFNTTTRGVNIGYGGGWRTNYHIEFKTDHALNKYYLLKPDGSRLYFVVMSSSYEDLYYYETLMAEDGSRMTLELEYMDDTLTDIYLKTVDQMMYHFDTLGRLTTIYNKTANKIWIYYHGSTNRISYVVDEFGNRIELMYNAAYMLTQSELKLKQPDGSVYRTVESRSYTYTGSGTPVLYTVTPSFNYAGNQDTSFSVGDSIVYSHTIDYKLASVSNETTGERLEYAYTANHKVSAIKATDQSISHTNLSQINVTYMYGKTLYTNQKGQWIEYLFDDYGHTINTLDAYGNLSYQRYAGLFTYSTDYNDYLGDAEIISYHPNYYTVHAKIESSTVMKQQINYISNHGFEQLGGSLYWEQGGNGSISKDYQVSALGEASLKVTSAGSAYAYQDVFLPAGIYTLRAIIKNTNSTIEGHASISVQTNSGTYSQSTDAVHQWINLSKQFEVTESQTVRIKLINERSGTDTHFDNIALTEGFSDARYNALTNASFEQGGTNWHFSGASIVDNDPQIAADESLLGTQMVKIEGDGSSNRYVYQDITEFITVGETYMIGGWGKANAVPHKGTSIVSGSATYSDARHFGLYVVYEYYASEYPSSDTPDIGYIYIPFNSSLEDWQYQMRSFKLNVYELLSVRVYARYQGEGTAYFDHIQLYHDQLSTTHVYDVNNGNMISKTGAGGITTFYEYDSNNNITKMVEGGKTSIIHYGSYNTVSLISTNNVRTTFQYDQTTRKMTESLVGDDNGGSWYKSTVNYTVDKQYLSQTTDEFGNTTTIDNNHLNGLVNMITDANNHITTFTYDNYGQVIHQTNTDTTQGFSIIKNFEYDLKQRIESIYIDGLTYRFEYDNLDRITAIKVEDIDYVTLSYINQTYEGTTYQTDQLDTQRYATGDTYEFIYDQEARVEQIKFNGEVYFEYVYDQSGNLAIYKDIKQQNVYFYSYDLSGKIKKMTDQKNNSIHYTYDELGHLNHYTYEAFDEAVGVYYFYNQADGTYDYTYYYTEGKTIYKHYNIDESDALRRLGNIQLLIGHTDFTQTFSYQAAGENRGSTSTSIETITYQKNGVEKYKYTYSYDKLGNITHIINHDYEKNRDEIFQYTYDGLNRLIREDYKIDDEGTTKIYTYDARGNKTSIKTYDFDDTGLTPKEEIHLVYQTSGWQDLIASINYYTDGNHTKTENYVYDEMGNLTAIESDGNQLLDWEGRKLVAYQKQGITYQYTYNDQGIRVSKTQGTMKTVYFVDGNLVLAEQTGNDVIYYTYDADATLLSMNYEGRAYFYIKNMQGDIIEIVDIHGNKIAEYRYDAWGKIIYQYDDGSNIDDINPYRYRGYRYDQETGLYYLNSRYYDPVMGRFISADSINYLDPSSATGLNLYAYCGNNPVMYSDPSGKFPILISLLALGAAAYMTYGAVKAHNTSKDLGYDGWKLAGYTTSGLIAGDYFVVRDNWDTISKDIVPGYDGIRINFNFTENKYYTVFTAGLYAKHLKDKYYVKGRTTLGMYIELQGHFIFDKIARPFGITNGNPAWMGPPDLNGDWTAWIAEGIARSIRPIPPIIPRLYP